MRYYYCDTPDTMANGTNCEKINDAGNVNVQRDQKYACSRFDSTFPPDLQTPDLHKKQAQ